MKNGVIAIFVKVAFLVSLAAVGQSGVYGNEWLEGKYGQEWLKISVNQKGVFKVTLSGNFLNKPEKLHLYHRGVEVALLTATNTEITFFGVPNDGKSDELLYRSSLTTKDPTARDNPYWSMYSDKSAYFLTFDSNNGVRASTSNLAYSESISAEPYHLQTDVTVFTNEYSHSPNVNITTIFNIQSYFESGRGLTGLRYGKNASATIPTVRGDLTLNVQFKNLHFNSDVKPEAEILLYGRNTANNNVAVFVGKTDASLRNVNDNFTFYGFTGSKKKFNLNISTEADASDITLTGQGIVKLVSQNVSSDWTMTGVFSCTYIKYVYPQTFNLTDQTKEFYNLISSASSTSRLAITNAPANCKVYDITNADVPVIIEGTGYSGSTLNVMVPRQVSKEAKLMVSSEDVVDLTSKTESVSFTDYNRSSYDYLMVSTKKLINKEVGTSAVNLYKQYRQSSEGGSMRPLLVDVVALYNQFNYGEPSPVAIRKFVSYMIAPEKRTKHNLLLIGHSVTNGDKLKLTNTFRELVDEVPTIGYPGSDILLVEGLAGTIQDVPAIPVGRITATTDEQVNNYLEKLKTYEAARTDVDWRKNVLHINGGVNPGESNSWATNIYNNHLDGVVEGAPFQGAVTEKAKPGTTYTSPFTCDIASNVNDGVGFISYFGHGNPHYTDYNIGYMSDSRRGYANTGKYPVLYFNGCGVGNIFKGSTDTYPVNYSGEDKALTEDYMGLSADWILASQKGAIAIIGNSYYAYESSSKDYLFALYDIIFKATDANRLTIGQIHKATASKIVNGSENSRVMAVDALTLSNTHQSNLQGDPALMILRTEWSVLPVGLYDFKVNVYNKRESMLTWKTAWEANNGGFVIERSKDARTFIEIGRTDGKGDSNLKTTYSFVDKEPLSGINYYRLKQLDFADQSGATKSEYSPIIALNFDELFNIEIYPIPVADELAVRMDNSANLRYWVIRDVSGKELKRGTNTKISVRSFPSSLYVIELVSKTGQSHFKKFVK